MALVRSDLHSVANTIFRKYFLTCDAFDPESTCTIFVQPFPSEMKVKYLLIPLFSNFSYGDWCGFPWKQNSTLLILIKGRKTDGVILRSWFTSSRLVS